MRDREDRIGPDDLSNNARLAYGADADKERALFTAGERRGIERAIEALASYGSIGTTFAGAVRVLESLRDAPAGEQNMSAGSSGSVDDATREDAWKGPDHDRTQPTNSTQPGESGGQLPALEAVVLGRYRGRIFEFKRTELRKGHGMAPPVPWMWQRLVNSGWYAADAPEEWAPMPAWSPGAAPPRIWGAAR